MSDFDPQQLMQLMSSDPAAARQVLDAALAARAAEDPRLGLLMSMLSKRDDAAAEAAKPVGTERRAARVRQRIADMREELEELHQRNEDLADALGACAVCWGRIRRCETCGGAGIPGWRAPDARLYDDLIAPAVARHDLASATE